MLGLEGATLGHYHLLYPLGLGGMSEVYLAHDEQLDRDVAIKVVPIERVILRALEKDPHQRFATPQALAQDYSQALKVSDQPATLPILARTPGLPSQSSNTATIKMMWPPIRPLIPSLLHPHASKRMAITALVALVLLLLTSFSLSFFAYNSSNHTQTHTTTRTTPQIDTNRTQQGNTTPTLSNTPAVKTSNGVPGTAKPHHGDEHRHRNGGGGGGGN